MKIWATATKLAIFTLVMVLFTAAVVIVFGQFRFGSEKQYSAVFDDVSGLRDNEFVRVAGVEVGKVKSVDVREDSTALVTFALTKNVPLTESTRAAVKFSNLIGDHYLELVEGSGPLTPLTEGDTIPVERTVPALDLDALINGFRPLFKALDPEQVNALSTSLVDVFQGQGGTIDHFLQQAGQLTSVLADRDQLIGAVIGNLNTLLGTVDRRNAEFNQGIDQLQQLVTRLGEQSDPLGDALVHIDDASSSMAALLESTRPDVKEDIVQAGRLSDQVVADQDYINWAFNSLPAAYNKLSRLGLFGDFFTFYLCDVQLKVNGPNGDPVYIPIVGQRAGRCTPQ
ncbi:MAG: MCE family protein [Rhodococcus sp. (in: high G+C Gram-positive bacteria)]